MAEAIPKSNLMEWSLLYPLEWQLIMYSCDLPDVWVPSALWDHQPTKSPSKFFQKFGSEIDFCKSSLKQGHLALQHVSELSKHSTSVNTMSCNKHKVIKGHFSKRSQLTTHNHLELLWHSTFSKTNVIKLILLVIQGCLAFCNIIHGCRNITAINVFLSWMLLWGHPQIHKTTWVHLYWLRSFVFEILLKGFILLHLRSAMHSSSRHVDTTKWQNFSWELDPRDCYSAKNCLPVPWRLFSKCFFVVLLPYQSLIAIIILPLRSCRLSGKAL